MNFETMKSEYQYPKPILGSAEEVVRHELKYHGKWWDKGNGFWFMSLLEEFIELGLSLVKLHKHPPSLELKHISAICIGWMDYIKYKEQGGNDGH